MQYDQEAFCSALPGYLPTATQGLTIVFVNGEEQAKRLETYLLNQRINCNVTYGDASQQMREEVSRCLESTRAAQTVAYR